VGGDILVEHLTQVKLQAVVEVLLMLEKMVNQEQEVVMVVEVFNFRQHLEILHQQ
jgi:hypothetical protein